MVIINLFCGNICEYSQIRYQAQLGEERLSYETIADWLSYCREICLEIVARESPKLIGGQGCTVEIEESKFDFLKTISRNMAVTCAIDFSYLTQWLTFEVLCLLPCIHPCLRQYSTTTPATDVVVIVCGFGDGCIQTDRRRTRPFAVRAAVTREGMKN